MTGTDVILHVKTLTGYDALNDPIYTESTETVHNVLVGEPTTDDVRQIMDLYGRKIEYTLGIPRGDAHDWEDVTVEIFGSAFRTFGNVMQGISQNIPTPWDKKVRVERYE